MTPPPNAPDRYAVLGHPVAHSRSPAIHARFAAQTGQALDYDRLECPLDGFAAAVRALAAGGARGCNVTVPFKFEALQLAGRASERARRAGAANVLGFDGPGPGQWWADNSDGIGLVRDIRRHAGVALEGARVLLVGAGGAAAGVLGPLLEAGVAGVMLANRTAARAEALVQSHADLARSHGATLAAAALQAPGEAFDVVLNASSSSLAGAAVPMPAAVLRPGTLAVDLMYGAAAAPFMAWARAHGAVPRDGLGMLVEQAAEAFFLWRGVMPDTAPVLAALRAEVDAA
ncbi:MAG: shikimate dehydrogenase [Burkholderiaceae bacterium]|jgi:shikimate dehydrogenase|nr:shikimate dehydrogenase [Burkholderiaceae bacterium]